MRTKCAPLVADVSLFCYDRNFIMYLSYDKQADIIAALSTKYLDAISNINDIYKYIY